MNKLLAPRILVFLSALTLASLACTLGATPVAPTAPPSAATPIALITVPVTLTPFVAITAVPTQAPVVNTLPPCFPRTDLLKYTIQKGDTLGDIAKRSGTTINQIAIDNCLSNVNIVTVGQVIYLARLPVTPTPSLITRGGTPPSDMCAVLRVGPNQIPIYSGSATTFPVIGYLGDWAPYLELAGDGYKIGLPPDNHPGWIQADPNALSFTASCHANADAVGGVSVSSIISGDAGNIYLLRGDSVRLTWESAPFPLSSASFYLRLPDGTPSLLGTDTNTADGIAINWTVPAGLSGLQLYAEGRYQSSNRLVVSNPISVSSAPLPDQGCQVAPSDAAGAQAYTTPDKNSPVSGVLPQGQWVEVLGRTLNGFYGFDPGIAQAGQTGIARLRWLAPDTKLVSRGKC